jgi:hypothetical protein
MLAGPSLHVVSLGGTLGLAGASLCGASLIETLLLAEASRVMRKIPGFW